MKYAFLISSRDTAPQWIDHDLSTSGEAIAISDSYVTSGVAFMGKDPNSGADIYTRIPPEAINTIKVYYPVD